MELVLDYISIVFVQISFFIYVHSLSQYKPKIKIEDFIIISLVGLSQVILNLYNLKPLSTFITIIYIYLMYIKIFNCTKEEAKNYSIIIWVLSMILDIIIMLIVSNTQLMEYYERNIRFSKALASIIMSLMIILTTRIPWSKERLKKLYIQISKIKVPATIIYLIIGVFLIIGLIGIEQLGNIPMILLIVILELSIVGTIIFIVLLKYENFNLRQTKKILEKDNAINQKIVLSYRIMKHNLENKLLGVKTIANQETKILIDNIIKEYNNSFYLRTDVNSVPPGIQGIVIEKLYKYQEIKTIIENKINNDILKEVGPRGYNLLCESLGVILDNALQAAISSKEKIAYILFRENATELIFTIKNSFNGKIDIEKLGTKNYTTKEYGQGLGIYSLIGRKRIKIKSSIKNDIFTNTIIITKSKKVINAKKRIL